jgi:Ca2+-binding EF-hand superfamily protein
MGCELSSPLDSPVYAHIVRTFDAQIRALRVSKDEVDALYLAWVKGDANADAFLSKAEFHALLGMRESKLTLRIYGILDRNRSGEVDFGEWFCSCWLYLSFSRMSLIALAFQLIDDDGNGCIDDEETTAFVRDLSQSAMGRDRNVNWHQLTFDLEAAHNSSQAAMTAAQKSARKRAKEVTEPIVCRGGVRGRATEREATTWPRRARRSDALRGPVGASEAAWRGRRSHRLSFPLPPFLRPPAPPSTPLMRLLLMRRSLRATRSRTRAFCTRRCTCRRCCARSSAARPSGWRRRSGAPARRRCSRSWTSATRSSWRCASRTCCRPSSA